MLRFLQHVMMLVTVVGTLGAMEQDLSLRGPLSSVWPISGIDPQGGGVWSVDVQLPDNWPTDAGIAAWVSDDDGLWWRAEHGQQLSPGPHRLTFDFRPFSAAQPVEHGLQLNQFQAQRLRGAGLLGWSSTTDVIQLQMLQQSWQPAPSQTQLVPSTSTLTPERSAQTATERSAQAATSQSVQTSTQQSAQATTRVSLAPWQTSFNRGDTWQLEVSPEVVPTDPYDDDAWLLQAHFTRIDKEVFPEQEQVSSASDQASRLPGQSG